MGLLTALFLSGCISLVEKSGQVLDGSAFAEKKTASYTAQKKNGAAADVEILELRDKAGESSILISLNEYPVMKLRGTMPDTGGEFHLKALEYLGGSVSGWNEYTLELSGTGKLLLGENEAILSIPAPPQAVQISQGRIHRFDTRITGNDALTSLKNRRERILALTDWMGGREGSPGGLSRKDFEKYWKPFLLPEMVSNNKRPPNWRQEGDLWVKAEDIRWNTTYTERVFPEELWQVRNTGTLLRDWEEALSWIYLEYEWENIIGLLSTEIILQRKK